MTQSEIDSAVAEVTGESLCTVQQRGLVKTTWPNCWLASATTNSAEDTHGKTFHSGGDGR